MAMRKTCKTRSKRFAVPYRAPVWRCVRACLACMAAMLIHADAVSGQSSTADGARRDFDFYVLSLSWSPSYCETAEPETSREQCASARPFSFVVHGLWPQFERGWPSNCRTRTRQSLRKIARAMSDIMPGAALVRHQWRKHGTCSGLEPADYFALTRKAFERITIPPFYMRLTRHTRLTPQGIERDFIAANPGLTPAMLAISCKGRRLREVRICLDKSLAFRDCRQVDRRGCRASYVILPPAR